MDIAFWIAIMVACFGLIYLLVRSPRETEELVERFNQENGIGIVHVPEQLDYQEYRDHREHETKINKATDETIKEHDTSDDSAPWFRPIELISPNKDIPE